MSLGLKISLNYTLNGIAYISLLQEHTSLSRLKIYMKYKNYLSL